MRWCLAPVVDGLGVPPEAYGSDELWRGSFSGRWRGWQRTGGRFAGWGARQVRKPRPDTHVSGTGAGASGSAPRPASRLDIMLWPVLAMTADGSSRTRGSRVEGWRGGRTRRWGTGRDGGGARFERISTHSWHCLTASRAGLRSPHQPAVRDSRQERRGVEWKPRTPTEHGRTLDIAHSSAGTCS